MVKQDRDKQRITPETCIIGKNIARLRRMNGLSQREVAAVLGTSFQQIQKYEKGQNRIPAERLHRLKLFFDVPYTMFFEGVGTPAVIPSSRRSTQDLLKTLIFRIEELSDPQFRRKLCQALIILSS